MTLIISILVSVVLVSATIFVVLKKNSQLVTWIGVFLSFISLTWLFYHFIHAEAIFWRVLVSAVIAVAVETILGIFTFGWVLFSFIMEMVSSSLKDEKILR